MCMRGFSDLASSGDPSVSEEVGDKTRVPDHADSANPCLDE